MTVIGKSMFPLKSSYQHISSLKARFDSLHGQLATGKKSANLAEMGSDRYLDLSMRARIGKMDAYQSTISTLNLRFEVLDKTMSRFDTLEADQRAAVTPGGYGSSNINFSTTPTLSRARLDEVLNLMNADVGGRYLFGGGYTDKPPVATTSKVLDGEGGRAGFKQVVTERKLADAGASGLGRLTVGAALDTVTLAEDGTHPFGLKLSTLSTTSGNVALTQPTGAPPALAAQFTGQPAAGEAVTLSFTLPDGSTEAVTLTATSGTPGPGAFQIGADPDATAANFSAALTQSLTELTDTSLAAASTFAAADNFFNGQGDPVLRVAGPPYDSATALVAGNAGNTMFWYTGEDSGNPRQSVSAKVDDGTVANHGVQANESGLLQMVRTMAAMAVETYPSGDPNAGGRFDAMATRQLERLSEGHNNEPGSIEVITVEIGLAKTTAANVGARHSTYKAQLETMLEGIEAAPTEEVAMELLALQTRLEASYQATAMVAQLSLVNFL